MWTSRESKVVVPSTFSQVGCAKPILYNFSPTGTGYNAVSVIRHQLQTRLNLRCPNSDNVRGIQPRQHPIVSS